MTTTVIDAARAEKRVKTLFGWLVFRRLSLPLSLRLARTPILPWHVTAVGLASGLAGAALLASGDYTLGLIGAVGVGVAKLLDAVDGEVARAKHLDSARGYVVDGLTDRLRDSAIIIGLGIGALNAGSTGALGWTLAAISGYLGFFYVSGATPSHWREIRCESDLDEKHMFRVGGRLRLGAGDTLAVGTFCAAATGHLLSLVVLIALASPVAIAMKTRRLLRNVSTQ